MHKRSSNISSDKISHNMTESSEKVSRETTESSNTNRLEYEKINDEQDKKISNRSSKNNSTDSSKGNRSLKGNRCNHCSRCASRSNCSGSCSRNLDNLELMGEIITLIKDSVKTYKNHNPERFRPGMAELIEIGSQTLISGIGTIQLFEDIRDNLFEDSDEEFKDEFLKQEKNDGIEDRTRYKDSSPNKNNSSLNTNNSSPNKNNDDAETTLLPPIPESFIDIKIENKEEDKHTSQSDSTSASETDYSEELIFPNN